MKRIALGFLLFLCLILALGIFFPYIFKGKIVRLIETELNKSVNAELSFDHDIRLNLFRSFPKLHLEVDDILIRSKEDAFEVDTLCHIGQLRTDLDLLALYRSEQITIQHLELQEPMMHIETSADSLFNWDIFPESETEDSSSIALELDEFVIEDGRFSYVDLSSDIHFAVHGIDHSSAVQMNGALVDIEASTQADDVFFSFLKVPYLSGHRFEQEGPIALDLDEMRFRFDQNRCKVNGLPLDAQVELQILEDGQFFDIDVKGAESTLEHYISLIPAVFSSDHTKLVTQGRGSLDFQFKGMMSETRFPAYHLGVVLEQGAFHYPAAKAKATDIALDLSIDNPSGEDQDAVVDIKQFAANINNQRLVAKTLIRQVFSNPFTTGSAAGIINLKQLAALIPDAPSDMAGVIDLDLDWSGPIKRMEAFKASGKLDIDGLHYRTEPEAPAIDIEHANILVSNDRIDIVNLIGSYANSDLNLQAECRDFIPYLRSEGILKANINSKSNKLNINDFISQEAEATPQEEADSASEVRLPTDLDLEFQARCDQLTIGEDTYHRTIASGKLKDGNLILDELRSSAFGGVIAMQAEFQTKDKHHLELKVDATDIFVQEVLQRFEWIRKYAPLGKQWNPKSMLQFRFNSPLDAALKPSLDQLSASGLLAFDQLELKSIPWASAIDKGLGLNHLSGKQLKDMLVKFRVADGKLFVDPIDLLLDQTTLHLEGLSKLDGSIDYTGVLDIPSSLFEKQQGSLNKLLSSSAVGDYSYTPDDYYKLDLNIGGSFTDPKVKLSMDQIRKSVGDQVKAQLDQEKTKLQEQANQEVQAVKDSLQNAAADAQRRAQEELDRQRREAEERLKAEAERKKKEAESKLKDRFKGVLGK